MIIKLNYTFYSECITILSSDSSWAKNLWKQTMMFVIYTWLRFKIDSCVKNDELNFSEATPAVTYLITLRNYDLLLEQFGSSSEW